MTNCYGTLVLGMPLLVHMTYHNGFYSLSSRSPTDASPRKIYIGYRAQHLVYLPDGMILCDRRSGGRRSTLGVVSASA
jgi:hypothetical protein